MERAPGPSRSFRCGKSASAIASMYASRRCASPQEGVHSPRPPIPPFRPKTRVEVIHQDGPWRGFDSLEFANLKWVA
jgi:hypothetical protein